MLQFYHKKSIGMLKLGWILRNKANICLYSYISAKFHQFKEIESNLPSIVREDMVGGPPRVFTQKFFVDETHIRNSTDVCSWVVKMDARQVYPYSMCQPLPIGLYTFRDLMQICKDASLVLTNLEVPKNLSCRTFNKWDRIVDLRTSKQQALRKKLIVSMQVDCPDIATKCLKQWVVFIITVLVKRHDLLYLKKIFNVEQKRGNESNAETVRRGKIKLL